MNMKTTLPAIALSLLLLAAAAVCWQVSGVHARAARLHEHVATLEFAAVADQPAPNGDTLLSAVAGVAASRGASTALDRATADYWLRRYAALTPERDQAGTLLPRDPELLFHAANAAYRASTFEVADRDTAIRRLEVITRSYADVLRANPDFVDAAYNFEFAARLASALAQGRPGATMLAAAKKNQPAVHGQPGAVPRTQDDSNINILVPKQGNERTDSPEGSKDQPRIRKG
jgi:hypothetical protein